MTFERSRDWALIKSIVTNPKVYSHVSDDYSPEASRWEPIRHVEVSYILAKQDDEIFGLFALIPDNAICWKAHPCLLPKAFGEKSREITKEFIAWVWQNTPCIRLIAEIPSGNQIVRKYASDAGMVEFGVNEKSLMKSGQLQDQAMYGISKPEELWA